MASALTLSRAALVGPFKGQTIPVPLPTPIDEPHRLTWWEPGPRLAACEIELLSGLHFDDNRPKDTVALGFVNFDKKPLKTQPLVRLLRPSEKIFKQQLELVSNYAELREDRGAEVLAQMTPQVAFWGSVIGLQAHRHKYTLELIELALSLAVHVEMRFKHAFACTRPVSLSPQVQPMIPTPGHGSWPSGHATEAFTVATVLQALLQRGGHYREQLERQAARIAVNRTVAGVHFPVDTAVGRLLGTALAEFFVARCLGAPKLHTRGFDGKKFQDASGQAVDFDLRVSMVDNQSGYYELLPTTCHIGASPLLAFMWGKAAEEWAYLA